MVLKGERTYPAIETAEYQDISPTDSILDEWMDDGTNGRTNEWLMNGKIDGWLGG